MIKKKRQFAGTQTITTSITPTQPTSLSTLSGDGLAVSHAGLVTYSTSYNYYDKHVGEISDDVLKDEFLRRFSPLGKALNEVE